MKTVFKALGLSILVLGAVLGLAALASAEPTHDFYQNVVFQSYSGYASTARTSAPFRVDTDTKKSIVLYGYGNGQNQTSGGTMTGTAALLCGGSSSGPFVPCKDINGNVVTTTSTAVFNLDSIPRWFEVQWTRTGAATNLLNAIMLYGD